MQLLGISLEEQGWKSSQLSLLPEAVSMLCMRSEGMRDMVIALLSEQVVHPAIRVRATTARLFFYLVRICFFTDDKINSFPQINGMVDPKLLSRRYVNYFPYSLSLLIAAEFYLYYLPYRTTSTHLFG